MPPKSKPQRITAAKGKQPQAALAAADKPFGKKPKKAVPVTVLSGFLGAGKTTLLKYLLEHPETKNTAIIVNDMAEVNIDAALVKTAGTRAMGVKESMIEMQNGCICCTLREDLLKEVRALADSGRFDYIIIESTGISEPLQVAETFSFVDERDGSALIDHAFLDTMVTVVDGPSMLKDWSTCDSLKQRQWQRGEDDERSVVDLLTDQLEFADIIIINKIDLMSPKDVKSLSAFIRTFNTVAKIVEATHSRVPLADVVNSRSFSMQRAEKMKGWLARARGDVQPESEEYGISSFVYRARRPFHPTRLHSVIGALGNKGTFDGVLRSKGFFWIATSNKMQGEWAQAGTQLSLSTYGVWVAALREMDVTAEEGPEADAEKEVVDKYWVEPYGDRRQEIVFIGSRTMQQKRITDALNDSLLTDAELKRGPKAWAKLEDPIAVLADEDVMEFLEVDDDDDDDESSSDAAPVKRGRTSKPKPHVHDETCAHSKAPAAKKAAAPVATVAATRRSSRRA